MTETQRGMSTTSIDEDEKPKPVILFGRDLGKIPCFKNSMLYGIYSGLAAALATFMFTSRSQLSTFVAVGSYISVSAVYFSYCRYQHVVQKYAVNDIKYLLLEPKSNMTENEVLEEQPGKLVDA